MLEFEQTFAKKIESYFENNITNKTILNYLLLLSQYSIQAKRDGIYFDLKEEIYLDKWLCKCFRKKIVTLSPNTTGLTVQELQTPENFWPKFFKENITITIFMTIIMYILQFISIIVNLIKTIHK